MTLDLISLRRIRADILNLFRKKGYTEAELREFYITENELINHTEGLTDIEMIEQKLALVMFDKFMSTFARTQSFTEYIQAKITLKHQGSNESLESYHDDDSDRGLQDVLFDL